MLAAGYNYFLGSHMALPLLSGTDQVDYGCCLLDVRLATPFGFGWSSSCFGCVMEMGLLHSLTAFVHNKTHLAACAPL